MAAKLRVDTECSLTPVSCCSRCSSSDPSCCPSRWARKNREVSSKRTEHGFGLTSRPFWSGTEVCLSSHASKDERGISAPKTTSSWGSHIGARHVIVRRAAPRKHWASVVLYDHQLPCCLSPSSDDIVLLAFFKIFLTTSLGVLSSISFSSLILFSHSMV